MKKVTKKDLMAAYKEFDEVVGAEPPIEFKNQEQFEKELYDTVTDLVVEGDEFSKPTQEVFDYLAEKYGDQPANEPDEEETDEEETEEDEENEPEPDEVEDEPEEDDEEDDAETEEIEEVAPPKKKGRPASVKPVKKEKTKKPKKVVDEDEEDEKPVKKEKKEKHTKTEWPKGFVKGDTVNFTDKKGEKVTGVLERYFWHKQSQAFWYKIVTRDKNYYKHPEDVIKSKIKER